MQAADNFRRIHDERQALISMWEQTLTQMQQRDNDIEQTAAENAKLKADTLNAQIALNEQTEFLKQEEEANEQQEKQVAAIGSFSKHDIHFQYCSINMAAERAVTKARLELKGSEEQLQRFTDEALTIRNTLSKTTADLVAKKADITQLACVGIHEFQSSHTVVSASHCSRQETKAAEDSSTNCRVGREAHGCTKGRRIPIEALSYLNP